MIAMPHRFTVVKVASQCPFTQCKILPKSPIRLTRAVDVGVVPSPRTNVGPCKSSPETHYHVLRCS